MRQIKITPTDPAELENRLGLENKTLKLIEKVPLGKSEILKNKTPRNIQRRAHSSATKGTKEDLI